jgi:hypothetical protein
MKPDVIVSWPRSCDYPLWRQFIRDNRERFAKVIVAFTDHDGHDYSGFVRSVFDATYVETHAGSGEDWRNVAVNAALEQSDSEFVWFTEQDLFFISPSSFWTIAEWVIYRRFDGFGWHENGEDRFHPSSLLVRRDLIDASSRDFAVGSEGDHFARFSHELDRETTSMVVGQPGIYEHLQGLTQNHWLIDSGITEGRFKEERLRQYITDSLEADVPLDPLWASNGRQYVRSSAA